MASRADRAKQFLPFDALNGLQDALREKETIHEEKIELSEYCCEKISNTLNKLERGTNVKVKYYYKNRYVEKEGEIFKINKVNKKLYFVDGINVNIDDIIEIKIV